MNKVRNCYNIDVRMLIMDEKQTSTLYNGIFLFRDHFSIYMISLRNVLYMCPIIFLWKKEWSIFVFTHTPNRNLIYNLNVDKLLQTMHNRRSAPEYRLEPKVERYSVSIGYISRRYNVIWSDKNRTRTPRNVWIDSHWGLHDIVGMIV